jgi:Uma2 family endonuclease
MQLQTPPRHYSPTEYLELEEQSECRHAYQDGEIIEMAGGSFNHNQISLNLALSLRLASKQQNYVVCMADMRLWIPRPRQYTYPDVMVMAGEPIFQENRTDTVINPLLIAEVLSKSTSAHDRGNKFAYYRSIPEMREYVLIDQHTCHVEHFSKTEPGKWLLTEYESLDDQLVLPACCFADTARVALQIPIKDLYDRVNFESVEV